MRTWVTMPLHQEDLESSRRTRGGDHIDTIASIGNLGCGTMTAIC